MGVLALQVGLVHVRVGVLGPVVVGVGVLMLDMVVLVAGVRVRVGHLPVLVIVRVRIIMAVPVGHHHLLTSNTARDIPPRRCGNSFVPEVISAVHPFRLPGCCRLRGVAGSPTHRPRGNGAAYPDRHARLQTASMTSRRTCSFSKV